MSDRAIPTTLLECHDVMEKSLCKARGILFVMSQVREPELESEQEQGWAIWAAQDLLQDAHDAFHKAQDMERATREAAATREEISGPTLQ